MATAPDTFPTQKPKRPWFKKKRFIIPLGTFLLLVLLGLLAPDTEPGVNEAAPAATSEEAAATAEPSSSEAPSAEPTGPTDEEWSVPVFVDMV